MRDWWVVDLVEDSSHTDTTHRNQPLDQIVVLFAGDSLKILARVIAQGVIVLPDKRAVQLVHVPRPFHWTQFGDQLGGLRPWVVALVLLGVTVGPIACLGQPDIVGHVDHVIQICLGVVVESVLDIFL